MVNGADQNLENRHNQTVPNVTRSCCGNNDEIIVSMSQEHPQHLISLEVSHLRFFFQRITPKPKI